jgi:hypothetical protein
MSVLVAFTQGTPEMSQYIFILFSDSMRAKHESARDKEYAGRERIVDGVVRNYDIARIHDTFSSTWYVFLGMFVQCVLFYVFRYRLA